MIDFAAIGPTMDRASAALTRITVAHRGLGSDETTSAIAVIHAGTNTHVGIIADRLDEVAQALTSDLPSGRALHQTAVALRSLRPRVTTAPSAGVVSTAERAQESFGEQQIARHLGGIIVEARLQLDGLPLARRLG